MTSYAAGRPAAGRASARKADPLLARCARAALELSRERAAFLSVAIAVLGTVGIIGYNAALRQPSRHPAPLFASPKPAPLPPEAPRRAETPAPAAPVPARREAQAPAPAQVGVETGIRASAPADPIGALLRGGDPSARASSETKLTAAQVLSVQRALVKAGYGPIAVDGVMGSETRQALERFERDRNIPVTGSLGPRTRKQLANKSGMQIE